MSWRVFQGVLEQPDNQQQQQLFRPDPTNEGINFPNVLEFFIIQMKLITSLMFYSNVLTKIVLFFFPCLCGDEEFFCLCSCHIRVLQGLNGSFHAGTSRQVDEEGIVIRFFLSASLRARLVAALSLPADTALLCYWIWELLSLECPSPGGNSTVCATLLLVHCQTSVTLLLQYEANILVVCPSSMYSVPLLISSLNEIL